MKMPRHTEEDKARFRALVTEAPGVEVKPMFGSLGAFVNGNMFAGLFSPNIGVKLDPDGLEELRAIEGSGPFGPEERPMGGYLSPAGVVLRRAGHGLGGARPRVRRHVAAEGQEAEVASRRSTSRPRSSAALSSPARVATASSTRARDEASGR